MLMIAMRILPGLLLMQLLFSPWHGAASAQLAPQRPALPNAAPAPQAELYVALARNVVLMVDQANKAGNYAPLLAATSSQFRLENDEQKLSKAFSVFRDQKTDMNVDRLDPVFLSPPFIDAAGLIRLSGYFDKTPLPLHFNLAFRNEGAKWLPEQISLSTEKRATNVKPPQPRNVDTGNAGTITPTSNY